MGQFSDFGEAIAEFGLADEESIFSVVEGLENFLFSDEYGPDDMPVD